VRVLFFAPLTPPRYSRKRIGPGRLSEPSQVVRERLPA
jgi:hypothetical protein